MGRLCDTPLLPPSVSVPFLYFFTFTLTFPYPFPPYATFYVKINFTVHAIETCAPRAPAWKEASPAQRKFGAGDHFLTPSPLSNISAIFTHYMQFWGLLRGLRLVHAEKEHKRKD